MSGFHCKNCGFDLSLRMDLLARTVQADHSDGDYPEDLSVQGACDKCGHRFNYSGELFTHWLVTKAVEDVINPEADKYAILEFTISKEEVEEFQKLIDADDKPGIDEFIRDLLNREKEDEEDEDK